MGRKTPTLAERVRRQGEGGGETRTFACEFLQCTPSCFSHQGDAAPTIPPQQLSSQEV